MYSYKFDEAFAYFDSYQKLISSKKAELVEIYHEDQQSGKIHYQKKSRQALSAKEKLKCTPVKRKAAPIKKTPSR